MRLIDIIRQKRVWMDFEYKEIILDFSAPTHYHRCEISLKDIRTPWQRFKFALWMYKVLGGKIS